MPRNRCIYCLGEESETNKLTKDHFFPQSWYPLGVSVEEDSWTVPACLRCNNAKSKLDQKYFNIYASCLPDKYHSDPEFADIMQRNLRTFDATSGKNPKDAAARLNSANKFMGNVKRGIFDYEEGAIPTIHLHEKPKDGIIPKIELDMKSFEEFAAYLVKGAVFKSFGGRIVSDEFRIGIKIAPVNAVVEAMEILRGQPVPFTYIQLGRAFRANICWVKDEATGREVGFLELIVWENFYFYAIVSNDPAAFGDANSSLG